MAQTLTSIPPGAWASLPAGQLSDTVHKIEQELREIWAVPDETTQRPKMRACTMNLVVVTDSTSAERVCEMTDALARTHAGRVFIVSGDPRMPGWAMDYEVSGVCLPMGGDQNPVCNDRVCLAAGALVGPRIHSVVSALTLAEVPITLEVGRGAPSAMVDVLLALADRVIVDSAQLSAGRIAELCKKTDAPLSDRRFVRTFTWRDLLARFFDDEDGGIDSIESVDIHTAKGEQDAAPLILGWLSSRLGWSVGGQGEEASATRGDGSRIVITRTRSDRADMPEGALLEVQIRTTIGGAPATFGIRRASAPATLTWTRQVQGQVLQSHDYSVGYHDEVWVLGKLLDDVESDRVYREAAKDAAKWA